MIGTADIIEAMSVMGYDTHHTPPSKKQSFVTVDLIAGGFHDQLARPSFAIQFWDRTDAAAERSAMAFIKSFNQSPLSGYTRLGNLANFPDVQGNRSRYQLEIIATSTF